MNGNKRRVTLKDIAVRTGYTVNTVSHALKDLPDIGPDTRANIRQVAREMGYVRNTMASGLRSGRSHTLGVIVGDLGNPKFAVMVNDIEAAARELRYSVVVLCTHEDAELERQAIYTAIERQVDGVILNPCQRDDHCLSQLRGAHMPFVLIERHFESDQQDCVVCDEERGGVLAVEHLLAQGCGKLVCLHGDLRLSSARARLRGFRSATAHLPPDAVRCAQTAGGAADARQLRALHREGCGGAFLFSDMAAWDACAHLEAESPGVLRAMRFVGFDNIQGKLAFPMPLCSVDPSSTRLCRATVELLDRRINGWDEAPQHLVFPVELVCRDRSHGIS